MSCLTYTINEKGYKTSFKKYPKKMRISSSNGLQFHKELQRDDSQIITTNYNLDRNKSKAQRMKDLFKKQRGIKWTFTLERDLRHIGL